MAPPGPLKRQSSWEKLRASVRAVEHLQSAGDQRFLGSKTLSDYLEIESAVEVSASAALLIRHTNAVLLTVALSKNLFQVDRAALRNNERMRESQEKTRAHMRMRAYAHSRFYFVRHRRSTFMKAYSIERDKALTLLVTHTQ